MSHIQGQDRAYWNARFAHRDWAEAGGNYQSLLFMGRIIGALQGPAGVLFEAYGRIDLSVEGRVGHNYVRILDYGCAEGDGTAVLQSVFPLADVVGVDWSPVAVRRAMERWPTLSFKIGSVEEPELADIIFTSHTIEHLTDPAGTVNRLLKACCWLVVVVPPITDTEDGGHTGAVPLATWLPCVPTPSVSLSTHTVRKVDASEAMVEGSIILVWKGGLNAQEEVGTPGSVFDEQGQPTDTSPEGEVEGRAA